MRKLSYYILFLFLFITCTEDKKKTNIPRPQKETPVNDSSSADKKNEVDTASTREPEPEPVKNIFEENEQHTTYNVKSISNLWSIYKSAKTSATKYISENNLDSIIIYLNIAADAAYELSREDIATWQLNNIGFYSITEFKKKTDYDRRMQKLATMQNLKEKGLYLEETKSIFSRNFKILSNAEEYLYKAQMLDSELEKSDRTEIIESNIQFINWVGDFISNGNRNK